MDSKLDAEKEIRRRSITSKVIFASQETTYTISEAPSSQEETVNDSGSMAVISQSTLKGQQSFTSKLQNGETVASGVM